MHDCHFGESLLSQSPALKGRRNAAHTKILWDKWDSCVKPTNQAKKTLIQKPSSTS